MEWQQIQVFVENRNREFDMKNGKVDRKFGINHLLGDQPDDYQEFIKKGNDDRILGRYADIEKLGDDIVME